SSRRRHTRFSRDWSSDVCSSDLISEDGLLWIVLDDQGRTGLHEMTRANLGQPVQIVMAGQVVLRFTVITELESGRLRVQNPHQEIGRASCRGGREQLWAAEYDGT